MPAGKRGTMLLVTISMALTEYKRKRAFDSTPEPKGGKPKRGKLSFVVQQHAASRLHYDFRLELDGVLLSWAVPKGPSMNPKEKRLAKHVEDHPFDYRDFEGLIPEGNYGAGSVILWDQGTYEPVGSAKTKKEKEGQIRREFEKGSMKFVLHGEKLRGQFVLVKMKGRDNDAWLLIKHKDEFATKKDVLALDQSVRSGMTIEELEGSGSKTMWESNKSSKRRKTIPKARRTSRVVAPTPADGSRSTRSTTTLLRDVKGKRRAEMPRDISPMLATLVKEPVSGTEWLYEVKWDGFRAISYARHGDVDIRSRNNKAFNKKFYPIYDALSSWGVNAVVDGEIVVVDKQGRPDFAQLQQWRSEADGVLIYYLFDILWLDGFELTNVPLSKRREILSRIVPKEGPIRLSEVFSIAGEEFFRLADSMGLEGIVAKKADSKYESGARSKSWLKIKTEYHQEAIIAGYTRNENSRKPFSALLLGVYDEEGELVYIGSVGTGFNSHVQKDLLKKMAPLETKTCPFSTVPEYNKPSRFRPNPMRAMAIWLLPHLVAEIAYRSGGEGGLRHPSFRGLREDKDPSEVRWEKPIVIDDSNTENRLLTPAEAERKTLLNPTEKTQVRRIEGIELKFTNLSKVYWPEEGYTKRDMLNYYYQVAPYMLPYMVDRPQTLNRFPNGIHGKSFYQKDVTGKVPPWVETYRYFSEGDDREKHFMVCTNEAGLLYLASLGCIEMNPWSSRTGKPDHPDWCVIDLDPGEKTGFHQVIEAARVTKEVLDAMDVPCYCKTSGSTGLHIYIPLGAEYTYEESKEFARRVARIVHTQLPRLTTIERKVGDRGGKMYVDFLQNRPQATLAGPYSLRPRPGAPVSTPLTWDEVKKGLNVLDFTIANAVARFKETGDLFQGVLGEGIKLETAVKAMDSAFENAPPT